MKSSLLVSPEPHQNCYSHYLGNVISEMKDQPHLRASSQKFAHLHTPLLLECWETQSIMILIAKIRRNGMNGSVKYTPWTMADLARRALLHILNKPIK